MTSIIPFVSPNSMTTSYVPLSEYVYIFVVYYVYVLDSLKITSIEKLAQFKHSHVILNDV